MELTSQKTIRFPEKDYLYLEELGQGACGRTIIVFDPMINEKFVCKKYSPIFSDNTLQKEYYSNFVDEIKLLHLLNHPNVVRVFTYHLYPEKYTGYIFMELVEGADIDEYLAKKPEEVNNIFRQLLEGFSHLEKNNILHRDIRPMNVLVNNEGVIKIIDFGFGKQIIGQDDFDKSISLNWWCEPPQDFKESKYNFTTEVYFVGKMFEQMIADHNIQDFKYGALLNRMCMQNPNERISSFEEARKELLSGKFLEIEFSDWELETYRVFSSYLSKIITKIEYGAEYFDVKEVQNHLEECLKTVVLEKEVPQNNLIARCFMAGAYYYTKRNLFPVETLRDFVELLRSCSQEKKNIIISNLQTKMDAIPRYQEDKELFDDDLPF